MPYNAKFGFNGLKRYTNKGGQAPTSGLFCNLQRSQCEGQCKFGCNGLSRYKTMEARPPHQGIDDRVGAKMHTSMPYNTKQERANKKLKCKTTEGSLSSTRLIWGFPLILFCSIGEHVTEKKHQNCIGVSNYELMIHV